MPLEDILKKIADKASDEASAILAEAQEKARQRVQEAADKALAASEKTLQDAKVAAKREMDIVVARAETERRQAILGEKQSLVRDVFDKALGRLAAMPQDEYRALLAGAIVKFVTGKDEVLLGFGDESRLGPDFPELVKARLRAEGKLEDIGFRYDKDVRGGGFILKQGGISLNVTFPAVLQKLSDELEIEAARILFQE